MILFEKFYNSTDELKKEVEKPFVRRKLKIRFQNAMTSIDEKSANLTIEVNDLSQNVKELNINRLLEIKDELALLKKDKAALADMYKEWFGKEMKDIDEE